MMMTLECDMVATGKANPSQSIQSQSQVHGRVVSLCGWRQDNGDDGNLLLVPDPHKNCVCWLLRYVRLLQETKALCRRRCSSSSSVV